MTRWLAPILSIIPLALVFWLARAAFFPTLLITCCWFGYRRETWPVAAVAVGWVVAGIYGGLRIAPSSGDKGLALLRASFTPRFQSVPQQSVARSGSS